MHITENSTLLTIKLYTSSIQYFLWCQWCLSLSSYCPQFCGNYSLLQSSWDCHSKVTPSTNSQNPFWYNYLKSISILSTYIHTGLLNGLFPPHFPTTNLFKITFIPMHATFLTHFVTVLDSPLPDKQYKLLHCTLCILLLPVPLSSVQTLFPSLSSQTTSL